MHGANCVFHYLMVGWGVVECLDCVMLLSWSTPPIEVRACVWQNACGKRIPMVYAIVGQTVLFTGVVSLNWVCGYGVLESSEVVRNIA